MNTLLKMTLIASIALAGCSTIHLHNSKSGGGRTAEEWHHDGILGLVEFSDPVDLSNRCPGGWNTVTTQRTFVQGLVGTITFGLYDPWNAKYTCAEGSTGPTTKAAPASPKKKKSQ